MNQRSRKFTDRVADRDLRDSELPSVDLGHLVRMTDDTGMLQHARGPVPDRHHGYCTDDNARALIVAVRARPHLDNVRLIDSLIDRYLAFLIHAYQINQKRFWNFLGYDRRWVEEGSDDCQGRALWALGVCASEVEGGARSDVAVRLFKESLSAMKPLASPRASAMALFGLRAFLSRFPEDTAAMGVRETMSEGLVAPFFTVEGDTSWPWPEDELTYANARLPNALIEIGADTHNEAMLRVGLGALTWLAGIQISGGRFAPVGNQGWFPRGGEKARFDQQPIEAEAMVSACLAAYRATCDGHWLEHAGRAFRWFLGENDLDTSLLDLESGSCCDGLGVSSLNENQGAESTLAWLLAVVQVLELQSGNTGK